MSKKNFSTWYKAMSPRQAAQFAIDCKISPRHMREHIMAGKGLPSIELMRRMSDNCAFSYRQLLVHFYDEG